jgi:hypothetical protein
MDLSWMTRKEVAALLRLLGEWGREKPERMMQQPREAERNGKTSCIYRAIRRLVTHDPPRV